MRDDQPSVTAVINAGGRSQRMAASGIALHKALVPVLGVPLVERNLCVLLDQGFRDIEIVVSAETPDVEAFARGRAAVLAAANGAVLNCIREVEPLGNMGAASRLAPPATDLLMTFVDNLTSLDLQQVVERHRESQAALTIATHPEPFQIPHGELRVSDDIVIDYLEKPTISVRVASGVYVLNARAAALISSNRASGAADLFAKLKDRGEKVAAFDHSAPWVDVNDRAAVSRADRMVAGNPEFFERRHQPPDVTDRCFLVRRGARILVANRSNAGRGFRGRFDVIRAVDATDPMLAAFEDAAALAKIRSLFDDFEESSGKTVRHDVSVLEAGDIDCSDANDGFAWLAADGPYEPSDLTQPLRRCIAIAGQFE